MVRVLKRKPLLAPNVEMLIEGLKYFKNHACIDFLKFVVKGNNGRFEGFSVVEFNGILFPQYLLN